MGKHSIDLDVCPCCGYRTGDPTCPVCRWTDDGRADADPEVARGGPNGRLSLADARLNYQIFGTSRPGWRGEGRPPGREDLP
ncbi:CPCC family cysteine-rich protein [Plantactinospora siamensis]|uniref:CPCC family cysteine-rich protein n=1 Tax=Plantactinospora siamensis TaxID=555372 RepID=A0ABV6NUP5_9ACTN